MLARNNSPLKIKLARLIVLLVPFFAFSPLAQAAASLADADQLLLENKYKQAETAYRGLIEDDQDGDAFAGLAVALAKQNWPNKIIEAEKILKRARNQFASNPNVLAAGGYVSYVHAGTVASPAKRDLYLDAAESLCKRAIKVNPDIVVAQQTLGLVKLAEDAAPEAVEPFRKVVEANETPATLTYLATALLKTNPKDQEADSFLDKALALKADYHPAHLQKAIILAQKGKNEDAFMELNNMPTSTRTSEWHLVAGDIYRKQGDGPAAIAAWQESTRLDPRNPEPYKHRAEYYTLRGDGELAINEMHNALEILPNDMTLRNQLAELALRQDKLDVAESEYHTILASQPDDARALLGLSRVYFRKARKDGQYPPGWQQLMDQLQNVVTEQSVKGQVIKAGAENLEESIELSEAEKALTQERFHEARQHFTTVINKHKENAYDLLTLGEQAFNDGDLSAAEQAFTFAKELPEVAFRAEQGISKIVSQRNEAARQTKLGDATWKLPAVAVDHYKQALIADPQYADAYYGLYSFYTKSDKPDREQALHYANCFVEATDEDNPLHKEVEDNISRMKKSINKPKRPAFWKKGKESND